MELGIRHACLRERCCFGKFSCQSSKGPIAYCQPVDDQWPISEVYSSQ